jgi:hypothetical protein
MEKFRGLVQKFGGVVGGVGNDDRPSRGVRLGFFNIYL